MSTHIIIIAATALVAGLLGWLARGPVVRRLRAALADATWQAEHDPLTALPNRVVATRHLYEIVNDARPATVTLLDLDGLKHVNDSHGHHAGDQLLVATASRLATLTARCGGVAYRLAGDEFLLLLPAPAGHDPAETPAGVLGELTTPVRVHPLHGEPVTLIPYASAGIAHFDGYDATTTELLHFADIALYHAKVHGDRWVLHHPGMQPLPDGGVRRDTRLRDQRPPRAGNPRTPHARRSGR